MYKLCKITFTLLICLTLFACVSNKEEKQNVTTNTKDEIVNKPPIKYIKIYSVEDQTYTGKEIKPILDLKDKSLTLVEGNDYILAYSDNIDIGIAKITITGKGNYDGTVTLSFKILENN